LFNYFVTLFSFFIVLFIPRYCVFPPPSVPFTQFCSPRILYTSAYAARISHMPKGLSSGHGELPISASERSSRSEGLVCYLLTSFLSFVVYLTTLSVAQTFSADP